MSHVPTDPARPAVLRAPGQAPLPGTASPERPPGPGGKAGPGGQGTVHAAGALCWHRGDQGLRVLLVHRPRYRDWSWPKGKLEAGERLPTAGVREVAEETGLDVELGIPLPPAHYALGTEATKHVAYWAAHVPTGAHPAPPRPREVDTTAWVSPAEAEARLTRRGDRVQLRALLAADRVGTLDTWPLVVVRHGHARPKAGWTRPDDERPLEAQGVRQALALPALMEAWGPERVVSSPWERCLATVRPYLAASGASLRTRDRLSEAGHRRDPARVARLVTGLLDHDSAVMLCTHRPVLTTVMGTLAGRASAPVADALPRTDPFLRPGEVLVAHVARTSGRVVAVERHLPAP